MWSASKYRGALISCGAGWWRVAMDRRLDLVCGGAMEWRTKASLAVLYMCRIKYIHVVGQTQHGGRYALIISGHALCGGWDAKCRVSRLIEITRKSNLKRSVDVVAQCDCEYCATCNIGRDYVAGRRFEVGNDWQLCAISVYNIILFISKCLWF